MRCVVGVIALLILSSACHAQSQSFFIYGLGSDSCGKYLAAVHGHQPGTGNVINHPQEGRYSDEHHRYMSWLDGFFTATNMLITNEPNGIDSDRAAIDVWTRKWCEQNPTKQLIDAAWAFAWDQRPEYLQAYFAKQKGEAILLLLLMMAAVSDPELVTVG